METKRVQVDFKELEIRCDGRTTHIIADGRELGFGCSRVCFEHDVNKGDALIRLTTEVDLVHKETAPGATGAGAN